MQTAFDILQKRYLKFDEWIARLGIIQNFPHVFSQKKFT